MAKLCQQNLERGDDNKTPVLQMIELILHSLVVDILLWFYFDASGLTPSLVTT